MKAISNGSIYVLGKILTFSHRKWFSWINARYVHRLKFDDVLVIEIADELQLSEAFLSLQNNCQEKSNFIYRAVGMYNSNHHLVSLWSMMEFVWILL